MLDQVLKSIESRREQSLNDLKEFLRIPSVSAQPAHARDVKRCAEWIVARLKSANLSAFIRPTPGHPIVVAKNEHRPGRPTVLFYGHYDVQPPEPHDKWTTPAFEPTVRKTDAGTDAIYARGAVDDKGQVWAHLEAISQWQKAGAIPVNLIMLIEGEEEVGSENLERFIRDNAAELKADIALISDTGQFARGVPAITYGLRGLVYMEVVLTGPSHDLHSGIYGGAVPNPAKILCEILATLHDKDGRVNIPGFYDDVVPLSAAERADWAKLPFDEQAYLKALNIPSVNGEAGYTSLERALGPPHLRHQRADQRLPGPRRQDDHSRHRIRESFYAPRARAGPAKSKSIRAGHPGPRTEKCKNRIREARSIPRIGRPARGKGDATGRRGGAGRFWQGADVNPRRR